MRMLFAVIAALCLACCQATTTSTPDERTSYLRAAAETACSFMGYDLGYFDDETCSLESL